MPTLFLTTTRRFLALVWATFFPPPGSLAPATAWRVLVMLVLIPVFALVQLVHWVGFMLDEVLFPGYRRVVIREPLFVLGVPRSGTTHLHRVLAADPSLTTFRTWECLFAPSITERMVLLGLARLDGLVGRPLGRLVGWIERRAFGGLTEVHSMSLADPEEDYFALTPILACFILVLPFPNTEHIWRLGRFDRAVPADERRRIMDFYALCLKKHLYVFGQDKRLLSKNAAFAPLAGSLLERFPDARVICCLREPRETLPSQLSSLREGLRLFGIDPQSPALRDRFVEQLAFYYENLHRALGGLPNERRFWVTMASLKHDLAASVGGAYATLGLRMDSAFASALADAGERSRGYRSGHTYDLGQFGLSEEGLARRFDPILSRLPFRSGLAAEAPAAAGGD